jgi:regulator of replication initiation timing
MQEMIERLSAKLDELMEANKELRSENERLRHIY